MTDPAYRWPTPITAKVAIQGQVVADGSVPDATPAVLDGLRVVWGRASTVEQPATSTAVLTLEDQAGDLAFAELAAIGRQITVSAVGTLYPDPGTGTFADPSFDTWPPGAPGARAIQYGRGFTVVEPAGAAGAGQWLHTRATTSPVAVSIGVAVPPAELTDPSDPTAWDDIPVPAPGQTWRQTIGAGWCAPGATLHVAVARFATPWTPNPVLDWPAGGGVWSPADGPWQRDYAPAAPGEWQGTYVAANPIGYAWSTMPTDVAWQDAPDEWTWQAMAGFAIDDADVDAPAAGATREVVVFAGRITDSVAEFDAGAGAVMVQITAADLSAELANRDVGAEPWPAEVLSARAQRILTAAGRTDVVLYVDPRPAGFTVTRMDVDRQQVMPMLTELTTSVDAVMWPAVHLTTGPYLWVEDTQGRTPVETLAMVGGVVVIVPASGGNVMTISACDIDEAGFRWLQTNADMATRCAVDWMDQTTAPDPTGRTAQVVLTSAEDPTGPYGVRRVQVSSQVTTEADALTVANGVLRRLFGSTGWRIGGATYRIESDFDPGQVGTALDLLDGTRRIGAPVMLTDLPAWSPSADQSAAGYLEGGTYGMDAGAWVLELVMSSAAGMGQSMTWQDLDPTWRWLDLDAGIRWLDMSGVGPNSGGTRP